MSDWLIRTIHYPGGMRESWATPVVESLGRLPAIVDPETGEVIYGRLRPLGGESDTASSGDPERNLKRAERMVKNLILANNLTYMWTLTSPISIDTARDADSLLRAWRDNWTMRKLLHDWVAVFEQHISHGWHIHLMVNERLRVGTLRDTWTALLRVRGYVPDSVKYARLNVRVFKSEWSAASYAAKYVSKSLPDTGTRYVRSHGLQQLPEERTILRGYQLSDIEIYLRVHGMDGNTTIRSSSELPVVDGTFRPLYLVATTRPRYSAADRRREAAITEAIDG